MTSGLLIMDPLLFFLAISLLRAASLADFGAFFLVFVAEVAGVTFSHFAPVTKFFNPDIFQIREPDSCPNSGIHRSNWQFTHV